MKALAHWLEDRPHNAERGRVIVLRFARGVAYTGEDRHEALAYEGGGDSPYSGTLVAVGLGALEDQALDNLEHQLVTRRDA